MTKRDDIDRDDDAVTPAEQARAEAFGRLVDGLLAGDPLPPAMDSDDRALVEAATVVMASSRAIEPAPERTRQLVDQALEAAILRRGGASLAVGDSGERPALPSPVTLLPSEEDPNDRSVTDVTTRRRRRSDQIARVLPWAVASLAAAAAIVLFIARPPQKDRAPNGETAELAPAPVDAVPLDVSNTSRPADPLVGRIAKADRVKASERIDLIYADRLSGYRDLAFRRALPGEAAP
jgi:hypothetical protein